MVQESHTTTWDPSTVACHNVKLCHCISILQLISSILDDSWLMMPYKINANWIQYSLLASARQGTHKKVLLNDPFVEPPEILGLFILCRLRLSKRMQQLTPVLYQAAVTYPDLNSTSIPGSSTSPMHTWQPCKRTQQLLHVASDDTPFTNSARVKVRSERRHYRSGAVWSDSYWNCHHPGDICQ